MAKSCGSCYWFTKWNRVSANRGLCGMLDASTYTSNTTASTCEHFKKATNIKQRLNNWKDPNEEIPNN